MRLIFDGEWLDRSAGWDRDLLITAHDGAATVRFRLPRQVAIAHLPALAQDDARAGLALWETQLKQACRNAHARLGPRALDGDILVTEADFHSAPGTS